MDIAVFDYDDTGFSITSDISKNEIDLNDFETVNKLNKIIETMVNKCNGKIEESLSRGKAVRIDLQKFYVHEIK